MAYNYQLCEVFNFAKLIVIKLFKHYKNNLYMENKIKIKIVNCPKCNFYPMIKIKTKYICEMCGYVLKKIVRKKRKLKKEV